MAFSSIQNCTISGVCSVVPTRIEDNLTISDITDREKEALVKHTGIRYRRIADRNDSIQAYFSQAIRSLCAKLNWEKDEIGVLICVTQTPQVPIPSIACLLHEDLDLPKEVLCFDVNSGCSGFVYGLHLASNLLNSLNDTSKKAILCCGDLSSQLIAPNDPSTLPIFSDGAAAIGIERLEEWKNKITGHFNLETIGKGKDAIFSEKGQDNTPVMRLNGIDVFNYSVKFVPTNIVNLVKSCGVSLDQLDAAVFHQANRLINESIRKKIKFPSEKLPYSLHEYGNTASASIPITWCSNFETIAKKSNWHLISGFGVGFSLASAVIPFDPKVCSPPELFLND